jgi:hypothetical protein
MTDYKNELEDMYSTFFLSFHPEHTGIMELGKLYLLKDTTQMISVLLCLINWIQLDHNHIDPAK